MTAHSKNAQEKGAAENERRAFGRFDIPGASLSYKETAFLRKGLVEEFCPIQNLSRGGLKMLCRQPIWPGRKLSLSLNFAEDDLVLEWSGRVAWIYPVRDADFAFSAGVQFDPFEEQQNPRAAAVLAGFEALEKKYARR